MSRRRRKDERQSNPTYVRGGRQSGEETERAASYREEVGREIEQSNNRLPETLGQENAHAAAAAAAAGAATDEVGRPGQTRQHATKEMTTRSSGARLSTAASSSCPAAIAYSPAIPSHLISSHPTQSLYALHSSPSSRPRSRRLVRCGESPAARDIGLKFETWIYRTIWDQPARGRIACLSLSLFQPEGGERKRDADFGIR